MAETKILFLEKGCKIGHGLAAIRTYEKDLVDIGDLINFIGDSGYDKLNSFFVKNNKVYRIIRDFIDIDKNRRVIVAVHDDSIYGDIYPLPEEEASNSSKSENTGN